LRELQIAKASITTGWNILLRELGVEVDEIAQVLLAGSFGAYLSPARTATTCSPVRRRRPRSRREPGTYFLTDFLPRTFEHTVMREPARAARRLLRPLHARPQARPAPDGRDARGGRARRQPRRAPAQSARGRRRASATSEGC
jgi:C-terminal domain of RACo the ASKHA domain